ncbi:cold shock domain-containing protein [Alteromonas genovensis]|uniref:cold shock domain-containing protein n=1 Tax=Alteromonas genovensis TaxID=471225 RepID=UPI002FE23289
MKANGRLSKWNDERGFGFITKNSDGQEVFVHISAFSRNSKRPVIGEELSFDIEISRDGKRKAVNLKRSTSFSSPVSIQNYATKKSSLSVLNVLVVCTLVLLGFLFYPRIVQQFETKPYNGSSIQEEVILPRTDVELPQFKCDGRQHCSQMNSRAEAVFFIRNCPNTKMDGDNDGEPCENDSRF